MNSVPQFTHTAIYVKDLKRMAVFYQSFLGLVVSDSGPGMTFPADFVFFTGDPDKHHQFVLATGRAENTPSTINQVSFRIKTLAELKHYANTAKACGALSVSPLNHGNALSIYVQDPESNTIEIYLDTPWYVSQPYGKPLDLTLSDDEIWSRTEAMVKADPTFMPRDQWMAKVSERIRAQLSN